MPLCSSPESFLVGRTVTALFLSLSLAGRGPQISRRGRIGSGADKKAGRRGREEESEERQKGEEEIVGSRLAQRTRRLWQFELHRLEETILPSSVHGQKKNRPGRPISTTSSNGSPLQCLPASSDVGQLASRELLWFLWSNEAYFRMSALASWVLSVPPRFGCSASIVLSTSGTVSYFSDGWKLRDISANANPHAWNLD